MARRRNVPAVPEPERLPWEKRKGEAAVAFHSFAIYRDLGPARTLALVAADTKKSIHTIRGLSAKYDWVERAEAYDDYVDRRLREARETERMQIDRAHMGLGAALVGLALRRINGAPAGVRADGTVAEEIPAINPAEADFGDVARLATDGVRIQRVAAGLPTDLIRGVTAIAAPDVVRMANDLVTIAQKFIPEDRQARFYAELDAYLESGRTL